MKRKAIIFPYNSECASIIRNRELLARHDIVACISPVGYGFQGKDAAFAYGGEKTGTIVTDSGIDELDFEDLLICKSSSDFTTVIMPQIEVAAKRGKNVIFLYNLESQYRIEVENICIENHVNYKVITNRLMDISKLAGHENEILDMSVPVIFVAGVIENTNKFDVQLGLRSFLLNKGYKVSQIGTKEYCEVFGFHAVPQFMFAIEVSENEKIVYFNRVCKSIEIQEKPDVFIIGIPGATMVFNEVITNKFGITAYEMSNAIRADAAIMCVPYEGYDTSLLKMIQTSSKYKFDMQVDCFNMANRHFDVARSKAEKRLSFITTSIELVDKRIGELNKESEIPIYNSFNSKSALEMYAYIVDKLSETEFGTI